MIRTKRSFRRTEDRLIALQWSYKSSSKSISSNSSFRWTEDRLIALQKSYKSPSKLIRINSLFRRTENRLMRGIMRTQIRRKNKNLRRRMHGSFVVSSCQTVASPGNATYKTVFQYGDLESEPRSTLESRKVLKQKRICGRVNLTAPTASFIRK